jgi:hypothetical protein
MRHRIRSDSLTNLSCVSLSEYFLGFKPQLGNTVTGSSFVLFDYIESNLLHSGELTLDA